MNTKGKKPKLKTPLIIGSESEEEPLLLAAPRLARRSHHAHSINVQPLEKYDSYSDTSPTVDPNFSRRTATWSWVSLPLDHAGEFRQHRESFSPPLSSPLSSPLTSLPASPPAFPSKPSWPEESTWVSGSEAAISHLPPSTRDVCIEYPAQDKRHESYVEQPKDDFNYEPASQHTGPHKDAEKEAAQPLDHSRFVPPIKKDGDTAPSLSAMADAIPEIATLMDCYNNKTPIVLIAARDWALLPFQLVKDHSFAVLGLFNVRNVEVSLFEFVK